MTKEERQAFLELNTYLSDIVIEDPDVDMETAKDIVKKARLMQDCKALDDKLRGKYRKLAEIFTQLFCN